MERASIGVIGGSGIYQIEGLTEAREIKVKTPFGNPSDAIIVGVLGNQRIAFLPRHGRGHRILPSELPVRANIYALKSLGVERIVSISAVGSLREDIAPLDIVIPDQLFDRTRLRPSSFFGDGLVVHISFADPFCPELSQVLIFCRAKGRCAHSQRRLASCDRRSAVLYQSRIAYVPTMENGYHWDDGAARGEIGA